MEAKENDPLIVSKPNRKRSIYLMLFVNFLASVCFSIVLSSLWQFIQAVEQISPDSVNLTSELNLTGWAVAANSAGTFLASPVFGKWFDKRGAREPLIVSLFIMIIGNIGYALSPNIYVLLTSRFVVGIAAANYVLAQTYLSYATTNEDRTKVMSYNSAATIFGFVFGPAFSAGLSFIPVIPADANAQTCWLCITEFRSPGWLAALMCAPAFLAATKLQEITSAERRALQGDSSVSASGASTAPAASGSQVKPLTGSVSNYNFKGSQSNYNYIGSGFTSGSIKDLTNIARAPQHPEIPWLPVGICLYFYFTFTLAFTIWETLGTPYCSLDYHWGTFDTSMLYGGMGLLCIISLVVLQVLSWYCGDRIIMIGATLVLAAGYAVMIDPEEMLPEIRFIVAASLASAGYAISVAVLISIYSKVLGSVEQGALMGWLSSAGSVARIIGPLFAAYAWEYEPHEPGKNPTGYIVFSVSLFFIVVALFLMLIFYRRLGPRVQNLLN